MAPTASRWKPGHTAGRLASGNRDGITSASNER